MYLAFLVLRTHIWFTEICLNIGCPKFWCQESCVILWYKKYIWALYMANPRYPANILPTTIYIYIYIYISIYMYSKHPRRCREGYRWCLPNCSIYLKVAKPAMVTTWYMGYGHPILRTPTSWVFLNPYEGVLPCPNTGISWHIIQLTFQFHHQDPYNIISYPIKSIKSP